MAFDAIFLSALAEELREKLLGARIDRVQQPERHTLILQVRSRELNGRLLLSASPNTPRVHLTRQAPENPAQPPMFCMLLRKHLVGGRIAAISQPPMERLLDFTLDCVDELGDPCQKHLIAELMGRGANLILTAGDGHIIDCLRRVDLEASEKRQVLPGLYYRLPPLAAKTDPTTADAAAILAMLRENRTAERLSDWLLHTFGGLSPLICRELSCLVTGETDAPMPADPSAAAALLAAEFAKMKAGPFVPTLLTENAKPKEFSYRPILQYGDFWHSTVCESFSDLLDRFYAQRDRAERMRQRTQSLHKTVTTLYERVCRKLENQRRELSRAVDRERLRQLGDIVTANLSVLRRGQTVLHTRDFYDPEGKEIDIPLLPTLSPQQNAGKYYKDYTKAKTAERMLQEQIAMGETERSYLASVLDELSRAETEKDVSEIRQELIDGGYLRDTDKKRMKTPPSTPMEFLSSEGFPIYVGRNNRQNDLLTFKTAFKNDLWFHTQKIHGSHVIVECRNREPGPQTVTEAAMLAAWFSQGKQGQNVPVDYTIVRNVKKPVGAKPGMVIYNHYSTAYVTPDGALPEKLKK